MTTEEKIQVAARKVFIRKGFAGARMQEIADEAGINKAMLHYYYRSKKKLFALIAMESFKVIIPQIGHVIESDRPIIDKLTAIVQTYLDTILANPSIPLFILHELSQRPQEFITEIKEEVSELPNFPLLFMGIQKEIDEGKIREVNPFQLLLSTLSMTIFPFICRPIFTGLIGIDDMHYDEILKGRNDHIKKALNQILLPVDPK